MGKIHKKYLENFEKLVRDWERLQKAPNSNHLDLVMRDLEQIKNDLRNITL